MARDRKNLTKHGHLNSGSSVGDAVRHGIAVSAATFARLRPVAAAMDPATIHHFRTTIRRLRSLLSSFKETSPPAERLALSDRLKKVSHRYAAIREWDVLIQALGKGIDNADPRLSKKLAGAAKRRRAAVANRDHPLPKDLAAIDREIAAAWLRVPSPGEAKIWRERIDHYAAELLGRQRRTLRKKSRSVDLSDPAAFHKFRIAVKKHRYTIESLSSLYRGKDVRPYLKRVIAIQDVLGEMRDAIVAEELIGRLGLTPPVRELATHWLARRADRCRERFPDSGKAFRRAAPFWER